MSDSITSGRTPLVLTSLTTHVKTIVSMLSGLNCKVISLVGSESTKEKRQKMNFLKDTKKGEPLVVVAIGKYIGEGFDFARLDTLHLALPVSWKGVIAQFAGRLHREYEGKTETRIYDYVDLRVPICDTMYRRRLLGYASIGYKVAHKEKIGETTSVNTIFSGMDFSEPFHSDLLAAKSSIVISCPRIKMNTTMPNNIAETLVNKTHEGLDVVVFTREADSLSPMGIDTKKEKCIETMLCNN